MQYPLPGWFLRTRLGNLCFWLWMEFVFYPALAAPKAQQQPTEEPMK